ncbi:MAG: hypothetical protein WC661_00960 [Opitutaceae bacterium]|jgi:hypothetical protein
MNTLPLVSSLLSIVGRPAGFRLMMAAAAFGLLSAPAVQAQAGAANLVPNGNLETPNAAGDWAANWGKAKIGQTSWEAEGGDHFIRMKATEPGKMMMIYNQVGLNGAKAVEVTVKGRVSELKKGAQSWFDARVMLGFRDAGSQEIKGASKPVVFGKDTAGWEERKVSFAVPEGTVFLAIMPTLLNVETGTFDFTEISVKAIDPATLSAPAAK